MKDLIELLRNWADFQEQHSERTLEDFYMFQAAKLKNKKDVVTNTEVKFETGSQLLKTINRIAASFTIYTRIALKASPLTSTDQFNFLAALNFLGESNKSEVINYAMMEMSTGNDILNRLIRMEYISQRDDTADKRSKLIQITKKGENVLKQCFAKNVQVRDFLLQGLTEDDKKICLQILSPVEEKHGKLSVESKQKTLEQILEENNGN